MVQPFGGGNGGGDGVGVAAQELHTPLMKPHHAEAGDGPDAEVVIAEHSVLIDNQQMFTVSFHIF